VWWIGAQAEAYAAVVLGAGDEDSNGFVVVVAAKRIVDEGDIEVELSRVVRLELARLLLDHDLAC